MPASLIDSTVFRDIFSTEAMRTVFSDENRVQKYLDFESALARAQARLGIIPKEAAEEICRHCHAAEIDFGKLKSQTERIGYPVLPVVQQLVGLCREGLGEWCHWGATTQDITDTATVLQIREALTLIERHLDAITGALAVLARKHRDTPMAGRTHAVQALPITFGHKCAIWLSETGRNYERLRQLEKRTFVGCLVGAVGTKASLGDRAFELDAMVMARLGLGVADISWHPARDRFVEYVGVLGLVGGSLAKIAGEIVNLAAGGGQSRQDGISQHGAAGPAIAADNDAAAVEVFPKRRCKRQRDLRR